MQTNPEQWAVELWRKSCHDYGGASIAGCKGERNAALAIQAAFAEREARLVGVLNDVGASLTAAIERLKSRLAHVEKMYAEAALSKGPKP